MMQGENYGEYAQGRAGKMNRTSFIDSITQSILDTLFVAGTAFLVLLCLYILHWVFI